MLRLHNISLYQYRNYHQRSFQFDEKVVAIAGANGTGKTNLLDSIYYLSLTKGFTSRSDAQNVQQGFEGFRIEGNYSLNDDDYKLVSILRENNKKEFSVNDVVYKRLSDHIGRFPCVMIAPDDIVLLTGNSEERRQFVDVLLSQLNRDYLLHLIQYNKILVQRNSLLKHENGQIDFTLLDVLSNQLAVVGDILYTIRNQFLQQFLQLVQQFYIKISGKDDGINLTYLSPLAQNNMATLLKQSLQKDLVLQRTTLGIHKDDLEMTNETLPLKTTASQGQRKTLLFALKLAAWQTLQDANGFAPILLLDDVFEKLDYGRIQNLLQWVCKEGEGQVFITDTDAPRLENTFQQMSVGYSIFQL